MDKKYCLAEHGHFDVDSELCSHYFRPSEICIQVKKRKSGWYLHSADPDEKESYGCTFQNGRDKSKKEIWDRKTNNMVVYEEIKFKGNNKSLKSVY